MTSCFTAANIWIRPPKRHSFHRAFPRFPPSSGGPAALAPRCRANTLARRATRWHDAIRVNSFGHFILTRFNVPLHFDLPPERQAARAGLDPGWLARRFELFERVCLASVARQTEPDFQKRGQPVNCSIFLGGVVLLAQKPAQPEAWAQWAHLSVRGGNMKNRGGPGRRFPRYGPAQAGFLTIFHSMEDISVIFPRYGRFSSTVWKTPAPLSPVLWSPLKH